MQELWEAGTVVTRDGRERTHSALRARTQSTQTAETTENTHIPDSAGIGGRLEELHRKYFSQLCLLGF